MKLFYLKLCVIKFSIILNIYIPSSLLIFYIPRMHQTQLCPLSGVEKNMTSNVTYVLFESM